MVDTNHKMILSSGKFSDTSRAELRAAFDSFASSAQKDTLVIHFHGGLVSQETAETVAETLSKRYQKAGGYPFFVIWQSWVTETLRNNWREIVGTDAFNMLVERGVQFLIGILNKGPGTRGGPVEMPSVLDVRAEVKTKQMVGAEPYAYRNQETAGVDGELSQQERDQFQEMLANDDRINTAAGQLMMEDAPELNPQLRTDLEQESLTRGAGERGLVSSAALITAGLHILSRCLKRFSGGRDHGLYTTVVEETARELKGDLVGGLLWRLMKQDTADAFGDPDEQYGGTALLKEIGRLWEAGHKPRIVLVGHSAGSVYICNLLQKAAAILPSEICFEVIFLAPACTFKLLDSTLDVATNRIRSFRCYGMKDENERKDAIFSPIYLYSLLYFVSGLLEDEADNPLVGMERYSSQTSQFKNNNSPEIARVLQKLGAFQSPWVWSDSTAGPGLGTLAHRHGDFDNDDDTLKSIGYLIEHGVM
jgi:hypothetical protein